MKNLANIYSKVDPAVIAAGLNWYKSANDFCQTIADQYNTPLPKVCAVLSALSPGTNYEQNKKDCENLIKYTKGLIDKPKFTTYGANVVKALNILKTDKNPLEYFSLKTGAKTYNFYLNILNPYESKEVTIDRHAYAIATGEVYRGLTPNQYSLVAAHYVKQAEKLGILPLQLQAVLWEVRLFSCQ